MLTSACNDISDLWFLLFFSFSFFFRQRRGPRAHPLGGKALRVHGLREEVPHLQRRAPAQVHPARHGLRRPAHCRCPRCTATSTSFGDHFSRVPQRHTTPIRAVGYAIPSCPMPMNADGCLQSFFPVFWGVVPDSICRPVPTTMMTATAPAAVTPAAPPMVLREGRRCPRSNAPLHVHSTPALKMPPRLN